MQETFHVVTATNWASLKNHMPDKMEKILFQLDTSLLAATGYFGNHTSNTAHQAKILTSAKGTAWWEFKRTLGFLPRSWKTYFCKAAWIKIMEIQGIHYSVVKTIKRTFLWYLGPIQKGA